MDASRLVGTWRLVSMEVREASGGASHPFGRDAVGYLLYSADGYMSGAIMAAGRPAFAEDGVLGGSAEERAGAAATYISYAGRYEVRGDRVAHHVEVSLFPNWVGGTQERFCGFVGDRLALSTGPMVVAGAERRVHLVWERAAGGTASGPAQPGPSP